MFVCRTRVSKCFSQFVHVYVAHQIVYGCNFQCGYMFPLSVPPIISHYCSLFPKFLESHYKLLHPNLGIVSDVRPINRPLWVTA